MIGNNRIVGPLPIGLVIAASLLTLSPRLPAQEPPPQAAPEQARPELPPLTAQVSPEEALAAIKRRAKKILESRRAARRLRMSGELSETVAYESNPATAPSRKGDTSFEQSLYLLLSKKLTPALDWQGSYYGSYLKYLDYGDGDYTSHTLTPIKLRWQPRRMWRVEVWPDFDYNFYAPADDSSYRQIKFTGRVRQNLFGSIFHQFQYEWFDRYYTHKRARDGGGANTLTRRKDDRNRLRYKAGATVKKALLTVENEFYWNESNDEKTDYYDYQVWKITSSASGSVTKKLYLSGSFAFERKNYTERPLTGQLAPARYDDKYTLSGSASYDVNDTWRFASGVTYDNLTSNETSGDYDNIKLSFLTVTAKF